MLICLKPIQSYTCVFAMQVSGEYSFKCTQKWAEPWAIVCFLQFRIIYSSHHSAALQCTAELYICVFMTPSTVLHCGAEVFITHTTTSNVSCNVANCLSESTNKTNWLYSTPYYVQMLDIVLVFEMFWKTLRHHNTIIQLMEAPTRLICPFKFVPSFLQ